MRRRCLVKFRPDLERFEAKRLLNGGSSLLHVANPKSGAPALAVHSTGHSDVHQADAGATAPNAGPQSVSQSRRAGPAKSTGFLAFRVTNTPFQTPYKLIPPFQQVLVQGRKPIPGQVYNVTYVAVKNGTAQTFSASNDFTVRMTNQPRSFNGFPILAGNEQWKPGQILVFYVLTKKYYAVSFVAGGFQFNLGGRSSTAVPGPAGIFLRLPYKPAAFARTLNWIVAFGPGNESGQGAQLGLPNTAINEIVSAKTHRADFAGHF